MRSKRRSSANTGNTKGRIVSNLFSGITFCGYCGSKMVISSHKSIKHNRNERNLVCYGARTAKTECACINWRYPEIEAAFLVRVSQLDYRVIFGTNKDQRIDGLEKQLVKISSEIDDNFKKIANLYKAIEEDPLPGLVKRLKELENQAQEMKNAKDTLVYDITSEKLAANSGGSRMANLIKLFSKMKACQTDIELRVIRENLFEQIKTLVEKIVLYPTGPVLSKADRDMQFFKVFLKSGSVVEVS